MVYFRKSWYVIIYIDLFCHGKFSRNQCLAVQTNDKLSSLG